MHVAGRITRSQNVEHCRHSEISVWRVARAIAARYRLSPGARTSAPGPRGGMTDDAPSILVVEDDAATRTFLADNLTADGHEVLVCDCARDALRLLEAKAPDLLLRDLGLPDASGLEVL